MASPNTLKNRIKKQPPVIFHNSGALGTYKRKTAKRGRNDACSCGSGNKFKKCCLGK